MGNKANKNNEPDYEIIPFGNEVLRQESKNYYNGILKCNLETITPVLIGGKNNVRKIKVRGEEISHNESYFLENESENEKDKQYLIPASSLKGMIRAIIDMYTNSAIVESKIKKDEVEYKGKPYTFIDEKFHPTNDNKNLSIGESIFGAIANSEVNIEMGENFKNIQSKIYFTDGKIKKSEIQNSHEILLKPLDSPKLKKVLDKTKTNIMGRKYYKHKLDKKINDFKDKKNCKSARNITVKIIDKGNKFRFDIYFKNLAYHELSILIYCLELEQNMYHKIGRGKALGMGSCKIEIEKVKLEEKEKKYTFFKEEEIYKNVSKKSFLDTAKKYLKLESRKKENIEKLEKILTVEQK